MSLLLLMAMTGCSSLTKQRQEQDLVEADLRGQERHIQELKEQLERKEGAIHGLDLEVERLQQAAIKNQPAGEPQAPGVIKEITLGRLTGGYRNNPRSLYDDSVQFLIEPKDADGHSIKMPGSVHIELFEYAANGVKVPLSAWDISARELRRSWDQPLFGGPAYRILVPFKALPANEKMRVLVRFTTLDGKLFEAEKDFSIRLPGPGSAPIVPMAPMPAGGYTVVTPGHIINGTLVGPLGTSGTGNPGGNMVIPPAPPGFEGIGRTTEPMTPLKNPLPEPEKKVEPNKEEPKATEKKQETIPVIPLEPRKTRSSIDTKGNQPPPLPPPPEIPNFDESKKSVSYEWLPVPSERPRTAQPIYPSDVGIVQAGYQPSDSTALTSPPPESWRQKVTSGMVQVEYSNELPIKLSRPIVVK
ncbi:MAG TPA: hypothetical protein PLN21_18185 [Gemmatales bacterium]|nr:hypothetical protein [Gemmatales bacterium]